MSRGNQPLEKNFLIFKHMTSITAKTENKNNKLKRLVQSINN